MKKGEGEKKGGAKKRREDGRHTEFTLTDATTSVQVDAVEEHLRLPFLHVEPEMFQCLTKSKYKR